MKGKNLTFGQHQKTIEINNNRWCIFRSSIYRNRN